MVVKFNSDKTGIGKWLNLFNSEASGLKEAKKFFKDFNTLATEAEKNTFKANFISQNDTAALSEYLKTAEATQVSLEGYTQWAAAAGKQTALFSTIVSKAKTAITGIATTLANMAILFVVEKGIELAITGVKWIQSTYFPTQEQLNKKAEESAEALDTAKESLDGVKTDLSEINGKIDTLLSKDSLTFAEEQDLQNLREEKALLEDILELNEKAVKDSNQDYLEAEEKAYNKTQESYSPDRFDLHASDGSIGAAFVWQFLNTRDLDKEEDLQEVASAITQVQEFLNQSSDIDSEYLEEVEEALSKAIESKKTYYTDELKKLSDKGLTGDDFYNRVKNDYIDFLKEIGDSATLVNYMDVTEGFDKAYEAAAKQIKSGNIKTADDLKEAIGDNLYQTFKEACDNVGIEVEDMIGNIYADLTDNLDSEYIASKISKVNVALADKGLARDDIYYKDYLQEIEDFTNALSDEQKQIYLGIVDSADTLTAAKKLYNESVYENDRQGYIDSHKIALSTFGEEGRRVTQVNESKEAVNTEFENFINKLSDTDYQIVLKLDVDASQSIEHIQEQIRNSKAEKTLNDVLSETFADEDGEDAKLEDIVSTVTSNIDKIKAKIVELNQSGITALSPSELIEFERLAPGLTTELDKWNEDGEKTAAAMEYLTSALTSQDDTLETYCNNLINLNNLTPEARTALQSLLDTIRSYEDFESPTEIPDYTKLLSQTFSGSSAGGDLVSISDKVSDLTSKVEVLKTALDTLDTDRIGRAGELMYENFDDLVSQLDMSSILQNFPELADEIEACSGSAEKLRDVFQNALNGIDNGLINKLNQLKATTPSLTTEIDLLIGQLNKLSNYDINLDLSMDTSQSMIDDYISKMGTLADLAIMTRDSYVVAFDDIRNVSSVFPEIMNGAQILADGTVQLNEDTVNSVISGSQAEMKASIQARVQELEGERSLVQAKIAYTQAKLQVAETALASETEADMTAAQAKIEASDTALNNSISNGVDEQSAYESATNAMMGNEEDFSNYVAQSSTTNDSNVAKATSSAAANVASASNSMIANARDAANAFYGAALSFNAIGTGNAVSYSGPSGASSSAQTSSGSYSGAKNSGSSHSGFSTPHGKDLLNTQLIAQQKAAEIRQQLQSTISNLKGQLTAYNGSLSDINTQIENLTKIGNMSLDQFVAPKLADLANNSGSGSGGNGGSGGGSGSGSDSAAEEYSEQIDWIEKAITRIEEGIQSLSTLANSTYAKFSDRNKNLLLQMEQIRNEITLQQQAAQRYLAEAEAVGLADDWKQKVQQGAVDIETITDETLKNMIDEYDNWYTKYRECTVNLVSLSDDFSAAYKAAFDLIVSEFDTVISQFEAKSSRLNEYISQVETQGYLVGEKYYEALIQNEQARISSLQEEATRLTESLNNAVTNGNIKEGSETWTEMRDQINDVNQSILEANGSILEFNNSIRQLHWDIFDTIQDRISKITDESDFLVELMSNSDLFNDKGKMTDEGLATLGLRGANYNTYMEQANEYAAEMKKISAELANDPNNKDLIERRYDLLDLQQESIQAAEDEKQAIKDLIKDGIEKELDSLQDLIDKYEDALDSQKDLFDYQKNVKGQKETISSLQKQLLAYANDDSESGRLNRQQLSDQLNEAQESLEETQYDQYISDQKALLSDLYDSYEETLNQKIDNLDALITECIGTINTNRDSINQTLETVSNNVGYTLSQEMQTIWGSEGTLATTITKYGDGFSSQMTNLQAAIDKIVSAVQQMVTASEQKAEENVKKTEVSVPTAATTSVSQTSSVPNNSSTSKSSTLTTGSGNGTPEVGDVVTYTGSYMYSSRGANPAGSIYSGKENAVVIEKIQEDSRWWHPTHPYLIHSANNPSASGNLGWVSLSQLRGYKTGAAGIDKDQYAWTQENGVPEAIVRPSDGAIMTPLMKFDSVLNGQATQNLFKLTNNPEKFYRENLLSGSSPNTASNNYGNVSVEQQFNITVAGVSNYEEFVSKMQKDNKFEKLVQSMTLDVLKGKSTIGKYGIKI